MICSKGAVRFFGSLAVLSIAISAAAQPRGYTARATGYDLNSNGIVGEAGSADVNLCDGQRDSTSTTGEDIDGNGVNDRQVYIDLSNGSDNVSCGLPGAPCRTITYALNGNNASVPGGPISAPAAGQIQAACFKGVGRETLVLTRPGATGTYTLPRKGTQVRSFNLPRYPFILSGWDANNNDQYPPYDTADTSVLDGAFDGASLPTAIRNSNHLSNLEIAHFTATNYGQNGDANEGFMKVVSGGGRAAQISIHDLQLTDLMKGQSNASGRDILDLFTGVSLTDLSVVNLNVTNAGGGYFARGSGGPATLQGPFRFQNISLTAFGAADDYWAGFKFWDYLNGIEILDNHFDANPRAWSPHASGGAPTFGVGVTHCASDWTIAGNTFTDFKTGVIIAPYGGSGYCESRLTENIVIDRNTVRNTYEPWNYGDNGILILAGNSELATTGTITITNNFLSSTTGWESCIWSNAGNPSGPQTGIVTIAGNTCYGRINRHSALVIGNPEGAQPAFPHVSYTIKDNLFAAIGGAANIGTEFAVTELRTNGNVFDPFSTFVWNKGALSLSAWRAATGGDEHSKQCVPALVDEAAGNFRLVASDGCAKAAGVSLAGITSWDIDGRPRSGASPSAGASEGIGLPSVPFNARLNFAIVNGSSTMATPAQRIGVTPSSESVRWMVSASQEWLTVTPDSGTGSRTLTVSLTPAAAILPPGVFEADISLSAPGASVISEATVRLTVLSAGATAPPIGVVDTPIDGSSGVTGSIPVTGWALDDIEVRQVRILRDPVPGEGAALVFIGNAVLVEGSRPDVAAAYPTEPLSTRAGWGYLMLTNFLPNQGNGTFKLHVMADDADGHSIELGTRTITCSNATAILPFGAIDTPGQGEVINGSSYANFGWVLARGPAGAAPPNGGTVSAFIDGGLIGAPGAWVARSDLAALFPSATYPGVTNALGVIGIDTTTLANGVHTIFWVVTANNSQQDGIGSRFFTVANSGLHAGLAAGGQSALRASQAGGSPRLHAPAMMVPARTTVDVSLRDEVNAAPLDHRPIAGRRGFNLAAPFLSHNVSANGHAAMRAEELDRIELQLGGSNTGYTRVGDELGPLPIGSKLDEGTGVFTWGAGVGFVHDYDLVFVRWANGRAVSRQEIRITLGPKRSNRLGAQVMIDTPVPNAEVGQTFLVGGWGIDPDDEVGTGIDTLHVWAYPASGNDPVFLGATAYGGARPDVAAIFGDRFKNSGYGLIVDSLPSGTYDLAVFAWSTVANGFVPAKVVRVTVR